MILRAIAGFISGEFLLYLFMLMCTADPEDALKGTGIVHAIAAAGAIITLAIYSFEFALTGNWGF